MSAPGEIKRQIMVGGGQLALANARVAIHVKRVELATPRLLPGHLPQYRVLDGNKCGGSEKPEILLTLQATSL